MNDEILFVRTLDDLHRSINSSDEYEVLRASALIRQLFLDGGNSIVDRISRASQHKHKLEFEVIEQPPPMFSGSKPDIWAVVDGIDPRIAPQKFPRVKKNRDKFFGMTVAIVDGNIYSILDLVKYVANVMGGVHSGSKKNDKENSLLQLRELYIFNNLSVALLFIKAIGRIILESMKPIHYDVLGIHRFVDSPGLSLHFTLVLFPKIDKETFILDIGTEESRNRVSIFLDYNDELCFRYLDTNGKRHLVKAGAADIPYRYGETTYLNFQLAYHENEMLMSIEAGGWRNYYVTPSSMSHQNIENIHYVLGSNVLGNAETNMAIMEFCEFPRILQLDEQIGLKLYFEERISAGYSGSARFEGNQFLHSKHHPNFPESGEPNTTVAGPSTETTTS